MNNDFFAFVEQYREDLIALLNAIVEFIKTLFDKLGQEEVTPEPTV